MNDGQIREWVFDLDNTLYPRHCDLFGQIDLRMTAYVGRLTGLLPEAARACRSGCTATTAPRSTD